MVMFDRPPYPWERSGNIVAKSVSPFDEWKADIEGQSDLEKAIVYAILTGETSHLCRLLASGWYELSARDRELLADFIAGRYRKKVGRRPKALLTPRERSQRLTAAQRAAAAVRQDMLALDASGASRRGKLDAIITRRAVEFNVDEEKVRNAYRQRKSVRN